MRVFYPPTAPQPQPTPESSPNPYSCQLQSNEKKGRGFKIKGDIEPPFVVEEAFITFPEDVSVSVLLVFDQHSGRHIAMVKGDLPEEVCLEHLNDTVIFLCDAVQGQRIHPTSILLLDPINDQMISGTGTRWGAMYSDAFAP
jgi:hypothetical protein